MLYLTILRKLFFNPTSLALIVFGLLVFGNYYQHNKITNLNNDIAVLNKSFNDLTLEHAHSLDVIEQNNKDCQDLIEKTKNRTITIVKHKKQLIESKNVDLDYVIPDDYLTTINETLSK
mgnify:CR=1 FL=1